MSSDRFPYVHKYPDKTPEDEEFVNRVILDKKTKQKNKSKSGRKGGGPGRTTATNSIWPEDSTFDADGGLTMKTSEILDFAEGVDSD